VSDVDQHSFRGVVGEATAGGRWVVVPFDVRAAFGEARPPVAGTVNGVPLRSRLERLVFTHRREYAQRIAQAKRSHTRETRVAPAVQMLREGIKHP
jgi:hypothetical protein